MITKFRQYNHIRYTFVRNLFHQYDMLRDKDNLGGIEIDFEEHLRSLQSSYIWNIYKHLTQEFLIKTAHMSYNVIEANVREKVLLPLKNEIIKIPVTVETDSTKENKMHDDIPDFKLVFRKEQILGVEGARAMGDRQNTVHGNSNLEFYTFRDFLT